MSPFMIIVAVVLSGMALSSFILVVVVIRSSQINRAEEEWLEANEKMSLSPTSHSRQS